MKEKSKTKIILFVIAINWIEKIQIYEHYLEGESVLAIEFSSMKCISQLRFTSTPAFKNSITQSALSAIHAKWNGVQPLWLNMLMIAGTGFRVKTCRLKIYVSVQILNDKFAASVQYVSST